MDDRGNIRMFESAEAAKRANFNIALSAEEAAKLKELPQDMRLARLAEVRHEERKARKEKYPGQNTAHLVGASR